MRVQEAAAAVRTIIIYYFSHLFTRFRKEYWIRLTS